MGARRHSDEEIDISTAPPSSALKSFLHLGLWFVLLVFLYVITALTGFDLTFVLLAVVGLLIVALASWFIWLIAIKHGLLTWYRLTQIPVKLFARGDVDGAERAYTYAVERARRYPANDRRRGVMLRELAQFAKHQGRYPEVIAMYEESVDILREHFLRDPMDYFVALNNYAICFIHLKDFASAQRILEQVVDMALAARKREKGLTVHARLVSSIEFVLHLNLGYLFIELNDLDEAKLHLEDSDLLLPDLPSRVRRMYEDHHIAIWGLWLYSVGQFAEAADELEKARDPAYPACLRLRSRLCLIRQDHRGAAEALLQHQEGEKKKGTLHRPEFVEHTIDLAECQFNLGDIDAAFAALEEARRLVGDYHLPRDTAWLKVLRVWHARAVERGRTELAQSVQKEIDAIPPRMPDQAIRVLEKFRVHPRGRK